MLGAAQAMGIGHADFWAMSVWEFIARADWFAAANGAKPEPPKLTAEDMLAKREKYRNG